MTPAAQAEHETNPKTFYMWNTRCPGCDQKIVLTMEETKLREREALIQEKTLDFISMPSRCYSCGTSVSIKFELDESRTLVGLRDHPGQQANHHVQAGEDTPAAILQEEGEMSGRRTTEEYRHDWEEVIRDHNSQYNCPDSPEKIGLLFERVRNDSQEFRSELEGPMAADALQSISQRISAKYGHEDPVEWHDHPEATLLAIGESAARRIINYGDEPMDKNERLMDWNWTLRAYAFSLGVEEGNAAWKAIKEHGNYEAKPVFAPEE